MLFLHLFARGFAAAGLGEVGRARTLEEFAEGVGGGGFGGQTGGCAGAFCGVAR